MPHNFDEIISRANTKSVKYDLRQKLFGKSDVLPLWVADMDFKVPPSVSKAIKERAEHEIYGYTIRTDSFYESVTHWTQKRYQWATQKEWLTFCPGIVPGINLTIMALTQPGDKIMIQPPVYFPFFYAIEKNNRKLVENRLILQNGRYHIDLDDFEKNLQSGVKLFILSNPHNPGGSVWTQEELRKMGELCNQYDAVIISDEIHADIVFPGHSFTPMASVSEQIAQNTVTFIAPSKTFNIAGLSTSISIIPNKELRTTFNRWIDRLHIDNGNLFGNVALEAAYNNGEQWLDELIEYLDGNIQLMSHFFEDDMEGIELIKPEGTYLAWLDCRNLPLSNDQINSFMVQQAGVGLNEGATFGKNGSGFQRLNFGCPREILKIALDNIAQAVNTL